MKRPTNTPEAELWVEGDSCGFVDRLVEGRRDHSPVEPSEYGSCGFAARCAERLCLSELRQQESGGYASGDKEA